MESTTIDWVGLAEAAEHAQRRADVEDIGDYGYGGEIVERYEVTNWDATVQKAIERYLAVTGGRIVYPETGTACCNCRCGRCAEGHDTGQERHTQRCHDEAAANPVEEGRVPLDRPNPAHCCCAPVVVGWQDTGARNWDPLCEAHGEHSSWYRHPAQVDAREAADRKARALQEAAGLARKGEIILKCPACEQPTRPRAKACLACGYSARQEP